MFGMVVVFEFFQFGQPVHHLGYSVAEFRRQLPFCRTRIFQYIMHQTRVQRLNVHVPFCQLGGNGYRVGDVGFAAFARLSVMGAKGVGAGLLQLLSILGIQIRCCLKQQPARFGSQRVVGGGG